MIMEVMTMMHTNNNNNKRKRKPTRFERLSEQLGRYPTVIRDKTHHIYKTPLPKGYLHLNNKHYDTEKIKYLSLSNIGLCLKYEDTWIKIESYKIKTLEHVHQK